MFIMSVEVNWHIPKLRPDEKLVWMSPIDFLASVPHPSTYHCSALVGIHDVSIEKGGQGWDAGSLRSIYKRIKEGKPIDALYLDYTFLSHGYPQHEGRHRALVCYKLGIKQVPVIIRR